MATLKPLRGKVLLKLIKEEKVTKSGIVLPDTVEKEELERAEVIAVGEPKIVDGKELAMQVKVGDKVILKKYGPDKIKMDGQDFVVAEEDDMIGIE